MRKIYTKQGDKGYTSTFSGNRVRKDSQIIQISGIIDTLLSAMDIAKLYITNAAYVVILNFITKKLWQLAAEVSLGDIEDEHISNYITEDDIKYLENKIDDLGMPPKRFVRFKKKDAIFLNECRTRTRDLERALTPLLDSSLRPENFQFINRLSDLFFMMAYKRETVGRRLLKAKKDDIDSSLIEEEEILINTQKYNAYKQTMQLNKLAIDILNLRYLQRDEDGNVVEDPASMFYRIAENIASADLNYEDQDVYRVTKNKFFDHLINLNFIPASPILMNAGTNVQYLFSDHVLKLEDSMDEIFKNLRIAAKVQQNGGGMGFSFSNIRPKNDQVSGRKNVAFGPLNVLNVFDTAFSNIIQAGRRSGANMAVLRVDHPDILDFITCKKNMSKFSNFNLSVAITDKFMHAVEKNEDFNLINPRDGEVFKTLKARDIFDKIVVQSWSTGNPGCIFIDEMNRKYIFDTKVSSTGACGQYPLEHAEGVPYAHINLTKIVTRADDGCSIDHDKLREIVHTVVHFLDNCIDKNRYVDEEIEKRCKQVRKIGLGVMGFADLLFMLNIPYGSPESLDIIEEIMSTIQKESREASQILARNREAFPLIKESKWEYNMRNATITTIAPTGTTSLIAGTSQSLEPAYALSYVTKTAEGNELVILNKYFQEVIEKLDLDEDLKRKIPFLGSIQKVEAIPQEIKNVFKAATDIEPINHLKVMAMFQKYIDASISKTINLPKYATLDDVGKIFKKAHEMGCKGVTIYRDGCRGDQVMTLGRAQMKLSVFKK